MKRPSMPIVILLVLLSGCESSTSLIYDNVDPVISRTKQGQECLLHYPFGLGRSLDLNGGEAMHQGGITKLRRIEYRVDRFHGFGSECVIAYGE